MRYIDFHTHILPEMDDGAKTLDESISMLKTAYACGAETVILTPHYLPDTSISEFCARRDEKLTQLRRAMKKDGGNFPKLLCGAEVLLSATLSEQEDLPKLCIEGTDLLLLEIPYTSWNKWNLREIHEIVITRNLTPVMAHIDRYLRRPKDLDKIDRLITYGAKFQVNAQSFLTFSGRRVFRALAAEGLISVIGSDCHDVKKRSADINRALTAMAKKFGEPFIDYLYERTSKMLTEFSIS